MNIRTILVGGAITGALIGCVSQSDVDRAQPADVYQCAVTGDMGLKLDAHDLCKAKIKQLEKEGRLTPVDLMMGQQQAMGEQLEATQIRAMSGY